MTKIPKKLKIALGFAVTGSTALFLHFLKHTKEVLSGAVDPSVMDVYEKDNSPYKPYVDWIKPTCIETKSLLYRVINYLRFVYARRLLNIAHGDNQSLRLRAIEHLTKLNLDKWQCCLIAHMCDARTAVGIARSTENTERFFLPPPRKYGNYNDQFLIYTIKDYLNLLYIDSKQKHDCLQKTVSKIYLQSYADINRILDLQSDTTEALAYLGKESQTIDILPLCLETISHHSAISRFTRDVLNHNGLHLLMEVHNRYKNDVSVSIPLCNILTNISKEVDLLEELYKAGWITILAEWTHHPDIRISGPASQALANLDKDDVEDNYSQNLFLLYPKGRSNEKVLVDVVFVHGLLGSVFYTWRNGKAAKSLDLAEKKEESACIDWEDCTKYEKDSSDPAVREYFHKLADQHKCNFDDLGNDYEIVQSDIPEYTNVEEFDHYLISRFEAVKSSANTQCWPRDWLPKDCGNLRVLGVNYSTSLSLWARMCEDVGENVTLDERSDELIEELVQAGVGKRPIVWVTHSMGGLLVKNVLAKGFKSEDPKKRDLIRNSKAIFFFSTPHAGSKTAVFNQTASYLVWPSMDVRELREDSPNLVRIHKDFLTCLEEFPMKVVSFVENKPTIITALKLNFELVEKNSGNPGVGELYEIPLNHLGICKPTNRQSFLYQKVLGEVMKIVKMEK